MPQLSEVGGKALSLIRSTAAGIPVPAGFALSVAFLRPWTDQIKGTPEWRTLLTDPTPEHCGAVKLLAASLAFKPRQQTALDDAMGELGDVDLVAVRSSSPEEDLKGTSFAGMYATYLGTSRDQLAATIAMSYASMFDVRVMAYKQKNGLDLEGTCISIVVQKQLVSDVSGIGFSLNPLNNCYDETVIEASFGLGEAIVSGIVTPDRFVVDKVTRQIREKHINKKMIAMHLGDGGGVVSLILTSRINRHSPMQKCVRWQN